jgi:hypothetical protein
LPKSEYVEVPGPERWVDVTEECKTSVIFGGIGHGMDNLTKYIKDGYRLRKVCLKVFTIGGSTEQWAFVVERRERT